MYIYTIDSSYRYYQPNSLVNTVMIWDGYIDQLCKKKLNQNQDWIMNQRCKPGWFVVFPQDASEGSDARVGSCETLRVLRGEWREGVKPPGVEKAQTGRKQDWVVLSNIFYFHPYLGKWSNLPNIFQRGWNHQPAKIFTGEFAGSWWCWWLISLKNGEAMEKRIEWRAFWQAIACISSSQGISEATLNSSSHLFVFLKSATPWFTYWREYLSQWQIWIAWHLSQKWSRKLNDVEVNPFPSW